MGWVLRHERRTCASVVIVLHQTSAVKNLLGTAASAAAPPSPLTKPVGGIVNAEDACIARNTSKAASCATIDVGWRTGNATASKHTHTHTHTHMHARMHMGGSHDVRYDAHLEDTAATAAAAAAAAAAALAASERAFKRSRKSLRFFA